MPRTPNTAITRNHTFDHQKTSGQSSSGFGQINAGAVRYVTHKPKITPPICLRLMRVIVVAAHQAARLRASAATYARAGSSVSILSSTVVRRSSRDSRKRLAVTGADRAATPTASRLPTSGNTTLSQSGHCDIETLPRRRAALASQARQCDSRDTQSRMVVPDSSGAGLVNREVHEPCCSAQIFIFFLDALGPPLFHDRFVKNGPALMVAVLGHVPYSCI